jgi:short-subunit dehydrogenase
VKIDGKIVLITGASEGIGAACAAEFARVGARLSLTARSESGLLKVGGADAVITPGDLTSEDTRRRAVERTLERFGAIDILINNAGIGFYDPSWRAPMEEIRALMELNFFAVVAMTQLVAPHMRTRRSGMIVNVSSIGGKIPLPWMTIYSASKYAINALTEGLRMELRSSGVHAMCVCPGYVRTRFQQNVLSGKAPEKVQRARRFTITAEECARAIRRGVEREARTVLAPPGGWGLVLLARLFPSIVESQMAGMIEG